MTRENDAAAVAGGGATAAPPCAMVIFGAAGDLTKRLVVPALYDLVCAKRLPERFQLVGVDLAAQTAAEWSRGLSEMMDRFVAQSSGEFHVDQLDRAAWHWLTDRMTYLYSGNDWLVTQPGAPQVSREAWTVKFEPTVVADFDDRLDTVAKIVGVSDDLDRVRRCEADAQAAFGQCATANRSQPYYLDVTHKEANKGAVIAYLSAHLAVPAEAIATIGDQSNDVLMFKRSGLSIAMGNASDQVKSQADVTTDSYNDEGFAKAIERFVLPSVG